ncbi:hypothetical protein Htur_5089 (plasmid) [Haloterrigena turkmenica DSM 5511]|uniref:HTH iclR-type domain-containing protein n=1 Tax=Haloterrigena turkmenica (strain ATCC 51198 / DSM 5511 / JCM 9101 / NCIMB 13204 / VKM B-1734 / 4k) TaxID=543526 RepID=D2S3M9_HALTV|nr:helix-turn-helix domain-containing protein [Haloterrigena turkmenica]ADB63976.1 hypothetical protein Htur_5089 [Haloterrigena turkmenica DSM 5511]
MTDHPTPEDYPGTGELPDKLAFVKPNRARAYVALHDADDPLTAAELAAGLEYSKATAYRCLSDLESIDLVCEAVRLGTGHRPKTAYTTQAGAPPWERARADGGFDQ